MHMRMSAAIFASVVSCAAVARPEVVTTFEGRQNPSGWTFGLPGVIPLDGGNPAEYLRVEGLDTFAPQPRTDLNGETPYTGNYRARNVLSVGVDLNLFRVDFSAEGRPLSVILVSDNNTPNNPDDDWGAYYVGDENIPLPGEGWKTFNFELPSRTVQLPADWRIIRFGPDAPANPQWEDLITNVKQLRFFFGDPELFFIFQTWDIGLDNARINSCPGDTNNDRSIDMRDLAAVLADFGAVSGPGGEILGGDVNGDREVNFEDLNLVLDSYGQRC